MDIIYLLIPIAIILVAFGTWAFFWSVNNGQFDDLESPAHRILYDDDEDMIPDDAKLKPAEPAAPQGASGSDRDADSDCDSKTEDSAKS